MGLEILDDVPDPDIVLVCCGGGALLSGISAAIKLSGRTDCRIYGVEPEGGDNNPAIWKSFSSYVIHLSSHNYTLTGIVPCELIYR